MLNLGHSKWKYYDNDSQLVESLSQQLEIKPIIIEIILNRGIGNKEDIKKFLSPTLQYIQKDFCPESIEKATHRVISAIQSKEKIVVFGDYDADGVTGTVVVYDALKSLGANVSYYVPFRYTEGYGLNKKAISNFKKENVSLIITVDCGISNVEEIALANELGIDVIITDHHTPPLQLPKAYAILNPKCEHKDLSVYLAGVGVAFKFICYLYKQFKGVDILQNRRYLELVAIGTITDVVPLLGDNRVFVKKGIEKLNRESSLGLFHLLEQMGGNSVNTTTIGYGIGPRINAAGRLESASVAIELLMTKDRKKAKEMADELNSLNERRKKEGEKIFLEATKIVEQNSDLLNRKVIVLSSKEWEPGVIGIVTSQMAKYYERPVVLITTKGDISRGSIRSFAGINIFSSLEKCQDLLISYGGHKEAAGFEIDPQKIEEFREQYASIVHKYLEGESLYTVVNIDAVINIEDLNYKLLQDIKLLEPFGEGNREPVFLTKNLNAIDYSLVGKDRNHLRVLFIQGSEQIEAIGFKMAGYLPMLESCNTFDVAYNLEDNSFNGKRRLQLKMLDMKPSQ